jgi:hypothetical protein
MGQGDDPDRTQEWVQNQARRAAEFINEMNPDVLLLMETENTNSLNILNGFLKAPFATAYITRLGDGTGMRKSSIWRSCPAFPSPAQPRWILVR